MESVNLNDIPLEQSNLVLLKHCSSQGKALREAEDKIVSLENDIKNLKGRNKELSNALAQMRKASERYDIVVQQLKEERAKNDAIRVSAKEKRIKLDKMEKLLRQFSSPLRQMNYLVNLYIGGNEQEDKNDK